MSSKILIIEDEFDVAENLACILEEVGYEVKTACNGLEGLRKIREYKPALVLCDIMMPKLDGYGVLEEIQLDKDIDDVPFIFLTAKVEINDLRKGMELGADDYLFKPIKADSLVRAVEARITKYKEKKKETPKPESNEESDKTMNEESTIFITIDNHPQFLKVNQITAISSVNQYTTLCLANNRKVTFRKSLNVWEATLPKSIFLRIHRSTIVNTNYITRVEKWLKFTFRVYIDGIDKPFEISKRYASRIKDHL
ncbi:MAG: response regulator [Bacteroidetes bacterium]|nr:response regulator [Bacteroidota bacterium]